MSQITKTRATARRPKRSPPPKHGERQVTMLRAGVELSSGELSVSGDRVNLPADQARALVRAGAAEFVNATPPAETGGDAA